MGVFARFRRRSTSTEEASGAEAQVSTVAAGTEEATDPAVAAAGAEPAPSEPAEAAPAESTESVEIPKQQSAEEAADSEAGESARR